MWSVYTLSHETDATVELSMLPMIRWERKGFRTVRRHEWFVTEDGSRVSSAPIRSKSFRGWEI